ncbi:MAG: hypothetical protein II793_06980 [Bacteroidales bacterium]|nr:hypothetical protein [Bacteroidales bacterium]
MQQVILNIENPDILPSLRKVLSAINGVTIVRSRRRKSRVMKSLEEFERGETTICEDFDDFLNKIQE